MSTPKQELNTELSRLIREYKERGLSPSEISDALIWHSELANSQSTGSSVGEPTRISDPVVR